MIVDQAGQHAPALEVDQVRPRTGELHHVLLMADGGEHTILDRNRIRLRIAAVERREQAAMQDQIGMIAHEAFSPWEGGLVVSARP
ncbi:hypothetical protein SSBR45G_44750 [Bradyrhizobium sp. SSBR45G]|nr:hypothetical protein SSBR45G_44750 [Bradyrhizobium sp. SSBR45G]